MKPLAVIWDRDGSMASIHNGPTKPSTDGDWAAYNAALPFDALVPEVAALLRSIRPGVVNIMVSGRMEGNKKGENFRYWQMWQWINKYELPIDLLIMRKAADQRRDSVVKEEILVNRILPFYNPILAVDDRLEVLEVWRKYGLMTITVSNPGTLPPIAFQT